MMNQHLKVILLIILFTEQFILATSQVKRTFLGNQGSSLELEFPYLIGIDVNYISCEWRHNGQKIPSTDIDKYQIKPRSITIKNIVGGDEGDYTCSFLYSLTPFTITIGQITVLGAAAFQPRQENLTAAIGDTVSFDTRMTFLGAGPQQRKQNVTLFQVFKDERQIYFCWDLYSSRDSPCSSSGRFTVVIQGSYKYDFYLSLSNVTVGDSGSYSVRVQLIEPITGSHTTLRKTINLTVTDPSLLPAPVVSIETRGTPNLGEQYSVLCNVNIRRYTPVQSITISWHYPSGVVVSSTAETNASLSIAFLHLSQADEGIYTCLASVNKYGSQTPLMANDSIEISINEVELPEIEVDVVQSFQLCVSPFFLSDCSALAVDSQNSQQLESEIRNEIVQNIKKRCPGCISEAVSTELIQPGTLKCSDTAARLIYRSTIGANSSRNASEIVDVIEEWVTSVDAGQATIQLWPFVMDLDSRCSVSISSLDSPYPTLGTGRDQARMSKVKERIESCLASKS